MLQIDYDQARLPSGGTGACGKRLAAHACADEHPDALPQAIGEAPRACSLIWCTLAHGCWLWWFPLCPPLAAPPLVQYFETMSGARRDGRTQQQYYDFSLNSARAAQARLGSAARRVLRWPALRWYPRRSRLRTPGQGAICAPRFLAERKRVAQWLAYCARRAALASWNTTPPRAGQAARVPGAHAGRPAGGGHHAAGQPALLSPWAGLPAGTALSSCCSAEQRVFSWAEAGQVRQAGQLVLAAAVPST